MEELLEQFGPYEMALKLKERGFNEPCFAYYNKLPNHKEFQLFGLNTPGQSKYTNESLWNKKDHACSAPLWQQIIDWFRVKHNYSIEIYNYDGTIGYIWMVKRVQGSLYGTTVDVEGTNPVDYEVARLEAINAAFELIDPL